ncbi:MAG: RDD family protein [bacterium]|nr:RDD family protein [bacterium]
MDIKKRSIAAVADVLIIRFMTIVAYCVAVSLSSAVHNRVISITRKRHLWKTGVLILLYIAVMLCIHFLYFFLSEKAGISIGKKLMKYEPAYGKAGNRQAVRVALFKTGACVFYVVTVVYFLFMGKMPYDKVREKGMENHAYAVASALPDKEDDHSLKEITIRRAIAFIIDYALFCTVFGLAAAGILTVTSFLWTENRNVAFTITLSMIGCGMVFLWGYFFALDRNPKLDLGKRLMKLEMLSNRQKFSRSAAFKHAAFKLAACLVWPISFGYYLIIHKMMYDNYLGITIKYVEEKDTGCDS